MCGIAGRINFNGDAVDQVSIQTMLNLIKHRGPDDEGVYLKDNIGLGHVRLSIIDLSPAGHQPMYDVSGDYLIVFNGEIYNYVELREELKSFYTFRSQSDTEVILAAYIKWGKECLYKFNGDWAFVIYHIPSGEVFGARDRFGIKPFYYINDGQYFAFASEIKALLPFSERKLNYERSFDFLVYNRTDHTNETFLSDIKKVPHGHYFTIHQNRVNFYRWYNLSVEIQQNDSISDEEAIEKFTSLFDQSIKLRLRSDVPVGVSLSGGLDSSSLLGSILEINKGHNVNTFSAIYKGFAQADESKFIELFSDLNIRMHFTEPNGQTFFNDLNQFIAAHGEPTSGIGPYAQFKVMELASRDVKVTLDGQGADEQLTGYLYFFASYFKELLVSGQVNRLLHEVNAFQKYHGNTAVYKYWLLYMLPQVLKNKVVSEVNTNISKAFYRQYQSRSEIATDLYHPKNLNDSLFQHFEYKLEHLLKWDDHNAMHFSVESRVPFLDHHLVEFVLGLRSNLKIRKGQTKYLLRESMANRLPPQIKERRDKKGFSTPADDWFRQSNFKSTIIDLLDSKNFSDLGIFDIQSCKKTYEAHLRKQDDYSKEIWKWLNFSIWNERYLKY